MILYHGEIGALGTTPLSDDSWTLPYTPLSLADFNQYSFAVINHNHEHMTFLSSVRPFSKLLNLRVVLGTPNLATPKAEQPTLTHLARAPMGKATSVFIPNLGDFLFLFSSQVTSVFLLTPCSQNSLFVTNLHRILCLILKLCQAIPLSIHLLVEISVFCITAFFCQAQIRGSYLSK